MGSREGTIKVAAGRCGLSLKEYVARIADGLKRCTICAEWLPVENFYKDRSRSDGLAAQCKTCKKVIWRRKSMMRGPSRIEPREGDAKQARRRINADVEKRLRPNPNDLYCALCGHKGDDKRHEYHHHMGYGNDHHNDVLPLCSTCHHLQH